MYYEMTCFSILGKNLDAITNKINKQQLTKEMTVWKTEAAKRNYAIFNF